MISGVPQLGARLVEGGVEFVVYATRARHIRARIFEGDTTREVELQPRGEFVFGAVDAQSQVGTEYKFVLDDDEFPDPYARSLPHGVHGPARVVAPLPKVRGLAGAMKKVALGTYEVHVGTFTPEGTFRAAIDRLDHLVELGVGAIELLPISSFPGRWGWGYDGVGHFAPYRGYGEREDLLALVEAAHARGLAVILDVVFNHFGPDGNYLGVYAPSYFDGSETAWGHGPNFANPFMRAYAIANARMWFEELGFDGLRLDATHAIRDEANPSILREIADLAASFDPPRVVIAEDERNDPELVLKDKMDAVWADDFHHQVRVLLTGERDGYFSAFASELADLARIIERGWLYEGQTSPWSNAPRGGDPTRLEPWRLTYCVQNHDQVGNRALGTRLSHDAGDEALLAATVLMLFLPASPLIFMGQEWAASTPFLFFADHHGELGAAVTRGRREEFKRFAAFADEGRAKQIPDPQAESTFQASKLDWSELLAPAHARAFAIHRAMFRLRREDPVIADGTRRGLFAEARGEAIAVVRGPARDRRLCVMNFGDGPIAPFVPAGQPSGKLDRLVATVDADEIPKLGAAVYALR